MSKSRKSGKRQTAKNLGDITINDFANSAVCKNRPKKSNSNVINVLKQIEEEKAWDEKEEYEGDFDIVKEDDDDGKTSLVLRKVEPRERKKTTPSNNDNIEDRPGNVYPLDIWFLISEYIRPEDVCNFARICKMSYAVVCSAKFWFNIYKRYITTHKYSNKSTAHLPQRFQPEAMYRLYGLRTTVIRALHFVYPPFKYNCCFSNKQHPHTLIRRQCVLAWQKNTKDKWVYYFKLKQRLDSAHLHSTTQQHRNTRNLPDLLEMLEDVCANQDEHCKVLKVTCSEFVLMPSIIGQTLCSASVGLSQGLRNEKLLLRFSSGVSNCDSNDIVLDPVISYEIFDWWHPNYPYDYNIPVFSQDY